MIVRRKPVDRSSAKRGLVVRASVATQPMASYERPLRGGPILAHGSVARRSRWNAIAPSSRLALSQNRLRHVPLYSLERPWL